MAGQHAPRFLISGLVDVVDLLFQQLQLLVDNSRNAVRLSDLASSATRYSARLSREDIQIGAGAPVRARCDALFILSAPDVERIQRAHADPGDADGYRRHQHDNGQDFGQGTEAARKDMMVSSREQMRLGDGRLDKRAGDRSGGSPRRAAVIGV